MHITFDKLIYNISYWIIYIYQHIIKIFDFFLPNIRMVLTYEVVDGTKITTNMNIMFYYLLYVLYELNLYEKIIPNHIDKPKTYIVNIKYNNVYNKTILNTQLKYIFYLSNNCSFLFKNNTLKRPIKSITLKNKNNEIKDITDIKYLLSDYSDKTSFSDILHVFGIDTNDIENIAINTLRKTKNIDHNELFTTNLGGIFI